MDTKLVHHEIRAMKRNVTVSMDEDTARWVRVEAAKRDMSVSQFLGEVFVERRQRAEGYESAYARFMARSPRPLRRPGGALPPRGDALVVAAARRLGCGVLLKEDLQDGQDLGGVVVRSPFTTSPG
jgi:hypothetical protein